MKQGKVSKIQLVGGPLDGFEEVVEITDQTFQIRSNMIRGVIHVYDRESNTAGASFSSRFIYRGYRKEPQS